MKHSWVFRSIILTVSAVLLLSGMVVADIEDNLTYQGNKARIAVGKIKDKADHCTWQLASAVGEMLSTALANSDRYIVLASQEEVDELIEEIDLGGSGYVEEGRGPEKGLMEGADILITGAVTEFEPDAGGSSGGLGGIAKKAFGKVGVKTKKAKMAMDIKIIDIRTRRILKAKTIKAESGKWKIDMYGGGWVKDVAMVGDLGAYSNEPMEEAIRASLSKTVEMLSKEIPKEYYRYQGQGQYTQEYGSTGAQATGTAQAAAGGQAAAGAQVQAGTVTQAAPPPKPAAEDMKLYTKYDFIPGDKVIFYDDMSDEEEAEFPYRWNLDNGVFEIAKLGSEYWILCTDDGSVRPRMADGPLPEEYTVEMEFYNNGPEKSGNYFTIFWIDAKGKNIGSFRVSGNNNTSLAISGKTLASKSLTEKMTKGVHVMRIMATSRSMKCFLDNVRVANVPRIEGFSPVNFRVQISPYNDPENPSLFRHFRFAEGGKSFKDQMATQGRIVTHGILFDKGSHVIKAESYKTLKELGEMLAEEPGLRVRIEGHTDSDGADDYNTELSQKRAESVKNYLAANYSIAADRIECAGKGESAPIDTNDTPEGKANNRRVELVKL